MRSARAGPRGGWPEVGAALIFLEQTFAVAEADVRKLRHDPIILATRAVQPALWLLVFGQVLAQVRVVPTGGIGYLDFMAPGILAQSSLFIAIFFGISVIWERDLGIIGLHVETEGAGPPVIRSRPARPSASGSRGSGVPYREHRNAGPADSESAAVGSGRRERKGCGDHRRRHQRHRGGV